MHCVSLKWALGHRSHRIQTDQPALHKQPVTPGQKAHTIALKMTLKTHEIDTSVINRNPENILS